MCSKTFDDAIFEELFEAKYGLARADMVKMNIKGVFQIWMRDGSYHEVPLKECHAWTREGCKSCPDFAAEHADISTGGIGAFNDWTLTLVRTDLGREIIDGMLADGAIETRPGDDDPGAIALLRKLSGVSRRRWPETAVAAPGWEWPSSRGSTRQPRPWAGEEAATLSVTARRLLPKRCWLAPATLRRLGWQPGMGSLIKKRRKRMRKKKHKKMLKATRWQRRAGR